MNRGIFVLLALGCGSDMVGDTTPEGTEPPSSPEASEGDWSCVGQEPSLLAREPARVQYVVPVVDFESQVADPIAVPDLQVQVCLSQSCFPEYPRCNGDLGECYGLSQGSKPYELAFDFPYDFGTIASLRFTAPGYVSLEYSLGGPMIGAPEGGSRVNGLPVLMLSEKSRSALFGQFGLSPSDPERGILMVRALSCLRDASPRGVRAEGVRIEPVEGEDLQSVVGVQLGMGQATLAMPPATDARGLAALMNLSPQGLTVEAQTPAGAISAFVHVSPGVITLAEIRSGLGIWGQ
jgi:hypothetical protein